MGQRCEFKDLDGTYVCEYLGGVGTILILAAYIFILCHVYKQAKAISPKRKDSKELKIIALQKSWARSLGLF